MNKKAIELGINALVVLILAIAALGMGIFFIRGVFKEAGYKADATITSTEVRANPTSDNPLVLKPSTLNVRQNENAKTVLYFLNARQVPNFCSLVMYAPDGGIVDDSPFRDSVIYAAKALEIQPDAIASWTVAIDTSKGGFSEGPHIFTATLFCGDMNALRGLMEKLRSDDEAEREEAKSALENNPLVEGGLQENLAVFIKQ